MFSTFYSSNPMFMFFVKIKVLPRFLVFRERFEEIGKKIKIDADAWPHQMAGIRRPMSGPHGTLNTITPCAACKLLRRRCAQECPFSPYFSPHEPHRFASVHKVFGASNVSKMLMVTISKHKYHHELSMQIKHKYIFIVI